jgi:hypothetical protein
MDAFLSHSSRNAAVATRVHGGLTGAGLTVWFDDHDIEVGALLRAGLQAAIEQARVLVLLWSRAAADSRWINSEWIMAVRLDRYVVPCTLDDTPLPQCLQPTVALPIGRLRPATVDTLVRAVRQAPRGRNRLGDVMRSESAALRDTIDTLARAQQAVTDQLGRRELARAAGIQQLLDVAMARATETYRFDPRIGSLHGYHLKNAYMVKHWDAIQAGRAPADPLLAQAERRFFETLWLDPTDPDALNGLGSILILERELDAAAFFVRAAIDAAKARGIDPYEAAESDLRLIEYYRSRSAAVRA